ncbi:MAG: serine hydrolase domain-containing protein [Planctomycetota bacterium]|nr:serine hydrolase domain-containing protein [Planctomycetota bacterium]
MLTRTLTVLTALACAAPSQQVDSLAGLLAPLRRAHDVPALGAAVLVDGELRALGVDGVRKRGAPERVTEEDLWHLGSCTKAMTATWLALLVAEGKLAWESELCALLPDLREGMHRSARSVQLVHLLRHRSGLPPGPPKKLWVELFSYDGADTQARTEVARALLGVPLAAKPGARFLYSNAGYMVAGAVGERAAGASWQQQLRERLFEPLGMERAGFGPPGTKEAVTQPWGHVGRGEATRPMFHDNPSSLGPAGTVHASLRDWAKFAAMHLGLVHGDALLTSAALSELHTPPDSGPYAHGWVVTERPWAEGPILTHSGSNTLWYCVAWLAPGARFAVLVTCNHGDGAAACDAVAAACVRRYAGG